MTKISIAMTTYNGEKYVKQQLLSLLNQTRKADEVIIRDDVSSDQTAQIVRSFIEENELENWDFTVNQTNMGFIKNFRQVISAVTGDIIFLCDQDDIWNLDKLEVFEKIFYENPNILALNGSFDFINDEGSFITSKSQKGKSNNNWVLHEPLPGEIINISFLEILKGNISPGCCMAFRISVRDDYISNATSLIPHDWEINVLAGKKEGLAYYNAPVIQYRIHDKNTIGMEIFEKEMKFTFSSNVTKRLKLFYEQEKIAEFLKTHVHLNDDAEIKRYIFHFREYVAIRKRCLIDKNPFVWVRLWKHLKYLQPYISKKSLFGDLIYAMRLEKYFIRNC